MTLKKLAPVFRVIPGSFMWASTIRRNLQQLQEMLHYRRVRDEIKAFVERLPEALLDKGGQQEGFQAGIQAFLDDLPADLTNRKED